MKDIFEFKHFSILQKDNAIKVSSDGILLGAWADCSDAELILDIGTGTGVIAIIAAHKNPNAKIDAVEIDELSCLEAQYNVSQCPACDRINVIKTAVQDYAADSSVRYDHILCNPPFFSGGTLNDNIIDNKKSIGQTTKLAHGELLIAVTKLLNKGGSFSVILPFMEGLRFAELAGRNRLSLSDRVNVKVNENSAVDRVLLSFNYASEVNYLNETTLIMHQANGVHTEAYKSLVQEFM